MPNNAIICTIRRVSDVTSYHHNIVGCTPPPSTCIESLIHSYYTKNPTCAPLTVKHFLIGYTITRRVIACVNQFTTVLYYLIFYLALEVSSLILYPDITHCLPFTFDSTFKRSAFRSTVDSDISDNTDVTADYLFQFYRFWIGIKCPDQIRR